jgi:hypothetical protein
MKVRMPDENLFAAASAAVCRIKSPSPVKRWKSCFAEAKRRNGGDFPAAIRLCYLAPRSGRPSLARGKSDLTAA